MPSWLLHPGGTLGLIYKWLGYSLLFAAAYGIAYHYNRRWLEWLRFQSLGTRDYIVDRLSLMFVEVLPQRILLGLFAMSFGLGTIVFLLFLPNLFPAILFGSVTAVVGWKAPKPIVDFLYRRRVDQFVGQMVDALNLMSNGLKSGLSIVQSMALVIQELPNPIREEFNLVLSQNKLGVSLEEAFTNLAKRVQADDVEMFVTAINILKETGGNLAETFDTISSTIRERIRVERKIQAMTAQGMLQGYVVMAVPPMLGLVFYQTDPDFMRPLFTTALGWAFVMTAIVLEIVGFVLILRIVKIKV